VDVPWSGGCTLAALWQALVQSGLQAALALESEEAFIDKLVAAVGADPTIVRAEVRFIPCEVVTL